MKYKKGLSTIIVTVLLVGLSLAIVGIVWGVVNGMVKKQLGSTESCFNIYGKVSINGLYTCYNRTDSKTHFSINIGDIIVEKVIVAISSAGQTKTFTITNDAQAVTDLANYGSTGFGTDLINLPGKNSGKTYIAQGLSDIPDEIKIAPV